MTVENIGNIADAYSNGKLPKCGMIISASREELMAFNCNLLYQEIAVVTADNLNGVRSAAESKYNNDMLAATFLAQVERCATICNRIVKCGDRTYTPKEVLAIIDELLDGIKPMKSVYKKAGTEARHHEESEVRSDTRRDT